MNSILPEFDRFFAMSVNFGFVSFVGAVFVMQVFGTSIFCGTLITNYYFGTPVLLIGAVL